MMHSCGDTHDLIPDFIAMGLDILDAMQPEPPGMDPGALRRAATGRLAFCGLLSSQHTLPFGTPEDCRQAARHLCRNVAKGGGYIFAPSQFIQAGTPLVNILAAYRELSAPCQ